MAVVLINPNSTEAMTRTMLGAARRAAPDLAVEGWTSHEAPAAIEGPEDGARAAGPLLELVRRAGREGAEAVVIGCFDDTALAEGSAAVSCPVIGIGQAAFHLCALRGWRFGVVTTLEVAVPVIEGNIARYGLGGASLGVRAAGVPVLDLERDPEGAAARVAEAAAACAREGIDALILGCAGMPRIAADVRRAVAVPVIDPVEAAMGCARWLAR